MRIAAHIGAFAAAFVLLGALWPYIGPKGAFPDLAALVALYLGLTARVRLASSAFGAIALGYMADVLMGTPAGAQALIAGTVCVLAHFANRRLLVRGMAVAALLSVLVGLFAGVATIGIRAYFGALPGGFGAEIGTILGSAALTGLAGPAVFRACRAIDRRLARAERERSLALEGLSL